MYVHVGGFRSTSDTLKTLAIGPILPGKKKEDAKPVAPQPAVSDNKVSRSSQSALLLNDTPASTGLNLQV